MARAKKPATMGDLIRSLVVIVIPLVLITIFFTRNLEDAPVTVVDWQPVAAQARSEAPFAVLAPVNVPPGWRATQATWVKVGDPYLNGDPSVRNLWKLGFLTTDDVFISLTQGDLKPDELVSDQTRKGLADGQSTVGGQTWERLVSDDGRTRSLVQRSPQVTTIVSGDLPYEGLDTYVGILSTSGS